eukprot:2048491-Pleurochrysis_carterae.AAC.1
MGVQIDGKRVANFSHLSDLDNRARLEVRRRCQLERSSMSARRSRCLRRHLTALSRDQGRLL